MSQLFHTTDYGLNYEQIPFQQLQVFGANSTYEWTSDQNVAYTNHNDGNNGYPVRTTDGGYIRDGADMAVTKAGVGEKPVLASASRLSIQTKCFSAINAGRIQ